MSLVTNLDHSYALTANSNDAVGSQNGTDTSITYSTIGGNLSAGFNGTSSKITTSGCPITGTGDVTIAFWFRPSSLSANQYLFSNRENPTDDNLGIWNIQVNTAGKFNFWDFNGGGFGFSSSTFNSTAMSVNTWYHLAFTRTGGTAGQYYFNGATDGTTTAAGTKSYSSDAVNHVLKMGLEGEAMNSFTSGNITALQFYSRALSGAEVTSLYNSGVVLQYPFSVAVKSDPMFMGMAF